MSREAQPDLNQLPRGVRRLLLRFRERLRTVLGENLVGIYFIGSIAFPGFVPDRVDIDFHVVIRRELDRQEIEALEDMHEALLGEYRYGAELDGFYLPLAKVRHKARPRAMVGRYLGGMGDSAPDDAWALHREHIHRGAFLAVEGPDPRSLYPPATWTEIAKELEGELAFVKEHLGHYPFYCVLNLSRLVYTWETREAAISKVAAAEWALVTLPTRWHALIRSALRAYRVEDKEADLKRLREGVRPFFRYASRRIAAARNGEPKS